MKKFFVFIAITLCLGFVSCSEDDSVVSGEGVVVPGENDADDSEKVPVLEDSTPSAVIPSSGFYVANEDWFGHDNGTVNYFKNDGSIVYRAYRAANEGEKFGVTTQFATIYGDYAYFVSKQGNRLVVADAKTLKKKAVFETLGGDGRSFLGIDDKSGYIGYNGGVRKFDINKLELGEPIPGVTGQIGSMCYADGYVFVVSNKQVYIINAETGAIEKTLSGSFNTLTRSKDGMVWIAASANFIKVNPATLEEEVIEYPAGMAVSGSWGAWNAGSLCASTQKNILYWAKGANVIKYDIDSKTANTTFYTLGKDEENVQLAFYGAALRVDPISDNLLMTVKRSGWGNNGSFNWIHIVKADGNLEKVITVKGDDGSADGYAGAGEGNYYWFPSIPFFEDNNLPEILVNQIRLAPGKTKSVDFNQQITDADNMSASILREVEFPENDLVSFTFVKGILTVTARTVEGSIKCKVMATSNGKRVEKEVRIDVVAE